MPAPPGTSYALTAHITDWTGTNAHAGIDSGNTIITIDNLSPGNVIGAHRHGRQHASRADRDQSGSTATS